MCGWNLEVGKFPPVKLPEALGNERRHVLANYFVSGPSEDLLRTLVEVGDALRGIHADYSVGCNLEDLSQKLVRDGLGHVCGALVLEA